MLCRRRLRVRPSLRYCARRRRICRATRRAPSYRPGVYVRYASCRASSLLSCSRVHVVSRCVAPSRRAIVPSCRVTSASRIAPSFRAVMCRVAATRHDSTARDRAVVIHGRRASRSRRVVRSCTIITPRPSHALLWRCTVVSRHRVASSCRVDVPGRCVVVPSCRD